jgi:hypothetical protein
MRTKKELKIDIADQAQQIMYFEASMPDMNRALKMLVDRLESIYLSGYDDAKAEN